ADRLSGSRQGRAHEMRGGADAARRARAYGRRRTAIRPEGGTMPLVQVKLIEGVFDETEKAQIIERLTDTMVAIEGEPLRDVTWVTLEEVPSGDWGIAGRPLTTEFVRGLRTGEAVVG